MSRLPRTPKTTLKFTDEELNILFEKLKGKPLLSNNSPVSRSWYYKKTYGINLEEYEKILYEQDFRCAICKIHQSKLNRSLYIDHCHTTGKIRGLLCSKCNSGIGFFSDSIKKLENAINYLKDNK